MGILRPSHLSETGHTAHPELVAIGHPKLWCFGMTVTQSQCERGELERKARYAGITP